MDDREKLALGALAAMVSQWVAKRPGDVIDSDAMSAHEAAIGALAEYGYVEMTLSGRIFGRWTEAGRALLKWNHARNREKVEFPLPPIPRADSG